MTVPSRIGTASRVILRRAARLAGGPAVVLAYHRVTDLSHDPRQLAVPPLRFREQMAFLRRRLHVTTVPQIAEQLRSRRPLPPGCAAVTFDDGYADSLTHALPILEEFHMPAVFYVTTARIGARRDAWWDLLDRIFLSAGLPPGQTIETPQGPHRLGVSTPEERSATRALLDRLFLLASAEQAERMLDRLLEWSGVAAADGFHRFLTADEISALARSSCVHVGAHGHTHTPLGLLPAGGQREELQASRAALAAITGVAPSAFSYPFGQRPFLNGASVRLCRDLGFRSACTVSSMPLTRWTSRFRIPRLIVRNWDVARFPRELMEATGTPP